MDDQEEATKSRTLVTISKVQKVALINHIKAHPQLMNGKCALTESRQLWISLTESLNNMHGAVKHWKQWKKTWFDMRFNAKTRVAKQLISESAKDQSKRNKFGPSADELDSVRDLTTIGIDHARLDAEILKILDDDVTGHETTIEYLNCESQSINQFNTAESEPTISVDSLTIPQSTRYNSIDNTIEMEIEDVQVPKPRINLQAQSKQQNRQKADALQKFIKIAERKNFLKEKYYARKVTLLERKTVAQETIAGELKQLVNMLTKQNCDININGIDNDSDTG